MPDDRGAGVLGVVFLSFPPITAARTEASALLKSCVDCSISLLGVAGCVCTDLMLL
jgi:hypothetical protein